MRASAATSRSCRLRPSHIEHFDIGQRQPVVSCKRARALPVKGAPNVVGTPAIVGRPVWVVGHGGGVLCEVKRDNDELEGWAVLSEPSELIKGAEAFGLRATDGGLRPPPPCSVEPSGIPTMPTDDPGPIDEAIGGNAVADAEQVPGAAAIIPPPSKSALPMPAEPPAVELPMALGATVIELPMAAGAGADEAPTHVAPIMGAAPDVIGLTPGVASSVAPMGIPVCPTGAFGMPRGDVMPSAGRGETFIRVCASAELLQKRTTAVATAKRIIIGSTFSHLGMPPSEAHLTKHNHTARKSLSMDCCDLLDTAPKDGKAATDGEITRQPSRRDGFASRLTNS